MNETDTHSPPVVDAPTSPAPAGTATDPEVTAAPAVAREPRWKIWLCFLLLLAAIQVALGPKIRLSQWQLSSSDNAAAAEAMAWLDGRLDIPHPGRDPAFDRMHDTAYYQGKDYNVFPPLIGFLTAALYPLHNYLNPGHGGTWLPWTYLPLIFCPLPVLTFLLLRREMQNAAWAAFLAFSYIGGTAVLPNLYYARWGHLGQINHVASQIGLLLIALDLLGKQRIWPALVGLAIAGWSRQMTCLYALPLLWFAWRRGRLPLCLAGLALIAAPMLALNWLKFGNPLDFGYRHIYANRETDMMAVRCLTWGTFSPHFLPEGLYYLFAAVPGVEIDWVNPGVQFIPDERGTCLPFTSPLWFALLFTAPRWWSDRRRRVLFLGTLPVMFGFLCYHSPGFRQVGYNRFALDVVPIWMAIFAPYLVGRGQAAAVSNDGGAAAGDARANDGRRSSARGRTAVWWCAACTAWSLLYFQAITPDLPRAPDGTSGACAPVSAGRQDAVAAARPAMWCPAR